MSFLNEDGGAKVAKEEDNGLTEVGEERGRYLI